MAMIDISQLNGNTELLSDTYFVDSDSFHVYSMKFGHIWPHLCIRKGEYQWYSLASKHYSSVGCVNIREDHLKQAVVEYMKKLWPVVTPTAGTVEPRGQWIIGTVTADGQYNFAPRPHIHETEASVNAEAERLARNNPGQTYVKVRLEGRVVASGITWS